MVTLADIERLFEPEPYEPWRCIACGGDNPHPLVAPHFERQWRQYAMRAGDPDPIGRLFCVYPPAVQADITAFAEAFDKIFRGDR